MAKFFAFIKEYWFGMLTGFILLVGFLFFLLILLSPRYDAQKRGFIPCTEALAQNLLSCPQDGKYSCIFAEIMKNTWCDVKVVAEGFSLWVKRKQSAPWSNYIFKPDLPSDEQNMDEIDAEFYAPENHPELDLLKLQHLNNLLEQNNATLKASTESQHISNKEKILQKKDKANDRK